MKRIAATAAVVLALLAVPATAMASTTHGGPQPPRHHPGPPAGCQPWGGSGFFCCPAGNGWSGGQSRDCQQQTITFSMRAFSSTATEGQGPRLSVGEVVLYQRQFYTVGSVWHRHFTLDHDGYQFRNGAYPIWDATATVLTGQWSYQNAG